MNNMNLQDTMDDYDYTAFDEIADGIIDTISTEERKETKQISLELSHYTKQLQ